MLAYSNKIKIKVNLKKCVDYVLDCRLSYIYTFMPLFFAECNGKC